MCVLCCFYSRRRRIFLKTVEAVSRPVAAAGETTRWARSFRRDRLGGPGGFLHFACSLYTVKSLVLPTPVHRRALRVRCMPACAASGDTHLWLVFWLMEMTN